MSKQKGKYVSLFKINGVPILPPLMTAEKREEMKKIRELASALESKLKIRQFPLKSEVSSIPLGENGSEGPVGKDYLKVLSARDFRCGGDCLPKRRNLALQNCRKSDTFIYDIQSNTVIVPCDSNGNDIHVDELINSPRINESLDENNRSLCVLYKANENGAKLDVESLNSFQSSSSKLAQSISSKSSQCSPKNTQSCTLKGYQSTSPKALTPRNSIWAQNSILESRCIETPKQSSAVKLTTSKKSSPTSPTLSLSYSDGSSGKEKHSPARSSIDSPKNSARNTYRKLDLPLSPHKLQPLLVVTKAHPSQKGPPLIRSNSFTLEYPSNVLMEHLAKTNTLPEIKKESTEKPKKKKKSSTSKQTVHTTPLTALSKVTVVAKTVRPKLSPRMASNTCVFKGKKSPYDIKLTSKTKLKKHKNALVKTCSSSSIKHKVRSSQRKIDNIEDSPKSISGAELELQNVFRSIEGHHRKRLCALLDKQREEQKQMKKIFEEQQRILLEEMSSDKAILRTAIKISNSGSPTKNLTPSCSSVQSPRGSRSATTAPKLSDSPEKADRPSPRRRLFSVEDLKQKDRTLATPQPRKEEAATILTAYVRGYLVRRLFRTNYVEKIVQTIRDTLVFVLNLHMETRYDESEENLLLKARLLQQLTSACYSLHRVFFELTPKERMNIIAIDREYKRRKSVKA